MPLIDEFEGDYSDEVVVVDQDAQELIEQAEEFLQETERFLREE